jgi:malonyl-CoA O-methyltransferase
MNELAIYRYPAATAETLCEPIVLLHGWGGDSHTWQPLLLYLQQWADVIAIDLPGFGESATVPVFELDSVLALVEQCLPERAVLIGWSLGGMLALALAQRLPQKITRVITLAANAKFVASADYPTAMPCAVNQQFNQGFAADAQVTLKIFGGLLAQGDRNERTLLKTLRRQQPMQATNHNWHEALNLLAQLDNRTAFAQLTQPGLHLLGKADVLVPVAAAQAVQRLNAQQQVEVLAGAAHALHWSQPQQVAQLIGKFLQRTARAASALNVAALDKRKVAHSFSRAAHTYDSVANLQRAVGGQLLDNLPTPDSVARVLDLGCGTGFFSDILVERFPQADIIGLDIAEGMLGFARNQHASTVQWLCGDAENLPLQSASVDVIFSSLAIQWCENLPGLFRELQRVLTPGGKIIVSTLGPATLHELKNAWQTVDGYVHVNRFQAAQAVRAALTAAGLQLDHWQQENRELAFERLVELTRELKALGAHNINRGQPGGLTGRAKIEALKQAYEKFRRNDYLPATYEVFYVVASRPQIPGC